MEDKVCNQTRYLGMLVAYVGKKLRERDLCDLHTGHGCDAWTIMLYWERPVTYILDMTWYHHMNKRAQTCQARATTSQIQCVALFFVYCWSPVSLAQLYKIDRKQYHCAWWPTRGTWKKWPKWNTCRTWQLWCLTLSCDIWPWHLTSCAPLFHRSTVPKRANVPWEQTTPDCQGSELR